MQSDTNSISKKHFGFLSNRVARLIFNRMSGYLESKGFNFPPSCIGVLADLWEADGKTQKELGLSMIKTKSSITKMLSHLENAGLIFKKENQNDKRNKLIFLTPQGHLLRSNVISLGDKMETLLISEHSKQDIDTAKAVLGSLYKLLQKQAH